MLEKCGPPSPLGRDEARGSWHAGPTTEALLQQQQPHCRTGAMRREKLSPHPTLQPGPPVGAGRAALQPPAQLRERTWPPYVGQGTLPAKLVPPGCWHSSCRPLEGLLQPGNPTAARQPWEPPRLSGTPRPPLPGGGIRRSRQRQAGFVRHPLPQRLSWCKHDPEAGHCRRAILQQECQRGPSAPAGGCADRGLGAS